MTQKEIEFILKKVEETIKTEGYCRAGYAIKEVLKCDTKDVLGHQKVKIASLFCKDGKYKNELAEDKPYFDLNIKRNPVKTEIIRFILTVASAVIISYITQNP